MLSGFCVIDTETTGVSDQDTPVEIAALRLGDGAVFETLLNPGRPIPLEARTVHHIRDEDVASAPTLAEIEAPLREFVGDCILVAHNASFDKRMLPALGDRLWLCSMRLARHVIADAFSYRNEALFEMLCPTAPTAGANAHRAAADARMTAAILPALIERARATWGDIDESTLLSRTNSLYVVQRMPFGKHRDEALENVPKSYLRWMLRECDVDNDLRASVEAQLRVA